VLGTANGAPAGPSDEPNTSFESTAVNLFGPLTFQDPYIHKRKTRKAWGIVIVYTSTSMVHMEMTEAYSTDSYLMAQRKFMTIHRAPSRFQ
jgi:hypothetical protein